MTELFETFADDGRPMGLVPRDVVHARGLWHRSAHVFLFTSDGMLCIQRRAADKDVHPDRWDLSVGEHLRPGEDYADGARRGLAEELGVTGVTLHPLGEPRRSTLDMPELGIADHEMQQAFSGEYAGTLHPDPGEVAAVRQVSAATLHAWIEREPDAFTPWFIDELGTHPELGAFYRGCASV
jgi:isopentenyldiphosphate isomerase